MELEQGKWYSLFSYDTAREILKEQEPRFLVGDTIYGIERYAWEGIRLVTPDLYLLYDGRCRFWTDVGRSMLIPVCCVRPQALTVIHRAGTVEIV